MEAVKMVWLLKTVRSLSSSTEVHVLGWTYQADLIGLCSDYLSHRIIKFSERPGDRYHPPIVVWNTKACLAFDEPSDSPPLNIGGYTTSWVALGGVPALLIEPLFKRLHPLGVLRELPCPWDRGVTAIWIGMPDCCGYDAEGRPIFEVAQRPPEGEMKDDDDK